MKRILAVLAAAAALALGALPAAAAGGWAVTYLDPAPSRFEGGTSYALGFWVLQHGSHPFEGDLGAVGLRFTGEGGKSLLFDGTALPEAGHYATSVVVPEGVWKVEGVQGLFQPYEVGTLTVPGGLKVNPVPPEMAAPLPAAESFWGAVRPPGFRDGGSAVITRSPQGQESAGATGMPQGQASAGAAGVQRGQGSAGAAGVWQGLESGVPAYALVIAAVGGALVVVAGLWLLAPSRLLGLLPQPHLPGGALARPLARVVRLARWSRRTEAEPDAHPSPSSDPPEAAGSSGETIVISGR
ncbi:hypothetical protein [Nonomuraea sp. NPDC005650]|uniref:hypothetical protein n=1 Tax=Nonomuraea sp. NPDC005650 TaxID=3157045 RepID=UPI0033A8DABF